MTTTTTADRLNRALALAVDAKRINEPGIMRGGNGPATAAVVRDKLEQAIEELTEVLNILGRRAASAE